MTARKRMVIQKATPMRRNSRLFFFPLSLTSLLLSAYLADAGAARHTGQKKVWEVNLAADTSAKSNIEVRNQCRAPHTFTVVSQKAPYLQLPSPPTITVPGNSTRNMTVTFNTAGMRAGQYEGVVDTKCDTCRTDPTCYQETSRLPIRLTVTPAPPSPTPSPTPPWRRGPTSVPLGTMPQQPREDQGVSCKDERCKVDTMILNTGYDHAAGARYTPVTPDGYWELVNAPNAGLTIPTAAWVIAPFWGDPWPDSNWISAYNTASWNANNPAPAKPYSFQRCFCTCDGVKTLDLDFLMLVDNIADIYFDNALIAQQTDQTTGSFTKPFHVHPKPIEIQPGEHCLRIDVRNMSGVAMGLNVNGTVKSASPPGAPLFLSPSCCEPAGKIMGRKVNDTNCDGKLDGEPGLPGWTITATNTAGGPPVTAVTDANGFYYFNDLPPGTYTVSETPQAGWTQTVPAGGGTYTVTLGANQVIQRDFGNCKRAQEACAHVEPREVSCRADGAGGNVFTFTVTNNSGKDVHQILLTPPAGSTFTLSPQVFNLPTPLQSGQSVTLTVNVGNVKPGERTCFLVTLMSRDGPCCTIEVCPVLPPCCGQITDVRLVPVAGAPGAFDYTFTATNVSPNPVEHIYITTPSGVMATPDYIAASIPANGSVTRTVRITGANPGTKVCFKISFHTRDMKECCSFEHCISIPGDALPRPRASAQTPDR